MTNKRNSPADDTSSSNSKKTKVEPPKILPSPLTSPSDTKSYRHILLPNGLRCMLISDSARDANPSWSNMNFEQDSYRLGSTKKALELFPPNPLVNLDLECDGDLKINALEDISSNFNQEIPIGAKAGMCLVVEAGSFDDPPEYQGMAHFMEHMLHYGSKKYPDEGVYWNFVINHGTHINAYTQCHTTAYQVAINPDFLEDAMDLFGSSLSEPLFDKQTTDREVQAVDSEFQLHSGEDFLKVVDIVKQSAKKGHPLRNFCCGNVSTLKKENLQSALRKFHSENYIAQRMTLAIQSTESLDTLQEIVEKTMSSIKSGVSKQQVKSGDCDDVFNDEAFSKFYKVQSERKMMLLIWKFDSAIWKDFKSKTLRLLEVLMNDGDQGSLRDIFLKRGWILSMDAKSPKYEAFQNHHCTIFSVCMFLTEAGQKNVERLVQITFDYIAMLRVTDAKYFEYIWEELKNYTKQAYNRCGNGSPLSNTHFVARRMMTNGKSPTFLSDEIVFEGPYNPEPLKNLLGSISAKKTLYLQFISGELSNNAKTRKMEHYNFKYSMENIPQNFLSEFREDNLEFPNKNVFTTNRFHIRYNDEQRQLVMDNKLTLVLAPNIGITTAKCRYQIVFYSSEIKSARLLEMFVYHLQLKIQNEVTQASRAGIKTMIQAQPSGVALVMAGFPEKMPAFLTKFCQIFDNNEIDNFHTIKQFGQLIYSMSLKTPWELMRNLAGSLRTVDQKSILETPNKIDSLTEERLKNFTKLFKSSMQIFCVLEGNVSHQEAIEVGAILRSIRYSGISDSDTITVTPTSLLIPRGERTIRIRAVDSRNWNNVVTNMYQIQKHDEENYHMCFIVASLMRGRAFQVLRTRQQLGYVVHVQAPSKAPVTFLITVICPQSKFTVCHVNERIDNFFATFYDEFLAKMTVEEFRDSKINLPTIKENVSLQSIQAWYKANVFDTKINKLSKISMQVMGSQNLSGAVKCSCELCKSIEFKSTGNDQVQFASLKAPKSNIAQNRKVIESISKFHNDEVRR